MFKCTQRWLRIIIPNSETNSMCSLTRKAFSLVTAWTVRHENVFLEADTGLYHLHTAQDWTQEQLISNSSFQTTHAKDQIRELCHWRHFTLYWNTTHSFPFQDTRKRICKENIGWAVNQPCQPIRFQLWWGRRVYGVEKWVRVMVWDEISD